MADPAATLRALADACEECDRISKDDTPGATDDLYAGQKQALADALPGLTWIHAISELRAMADTVDRLTRERDEARELLSAALESVDVTNMDVLAGQIRAWLGVCDG